MKEKDLAPNPDKNAPEDLEDDLSRVITLEMEDGSEKDFVALDIIHHEGHSYIALSEVDSMDYDVLRFVEADDVLELSIIEDDDEYTKITNLFQAKLEEMLYEEDGDEFEALDDDDDEDEDDEDNKEDEVEKELTS